MAVRCEDKFQIVINGHIEL